MIYFSKNFILMRVLILLAATAPVLAFSQVKRITIDGHSQGKVFEGFGALSAGASSRLLIDYPEPYRSQILDYLFKPGYGAALQHLKVEIGGDVNSTDGSEPSHMRSATDHDYTRGYEWWLMQEAKERNPHIILDTLPWGASGWVGTKTLYTEKMTEYVADFLKGAKAQHGIDIPYTGIWNERRYDADYVKQLRRTLDASGLRDTKIVCCDMYETSHGEQWRIADAMKKDSELNSAVAVIGSHYPQEKGKLTTTDSARESGKPLWSSEDQPNSGGGPILSRDWKIGGRIMANVYNRNYLEGAMTKTEIWSPITSYYDILAAPNSGLMYANTPWSGYYDVQSTIWVTAHTTQFTQPGWRYLDTSSGEIEGVTYVTLLSPDKKNWSIVFETTGAQTPVSIRFNVAGGLRAQPLHVWETNGNKSFEHLADLEPHEGVYTYTFDADSIYTLTTTTGQGKGTAKPPASSPFPMPYREDFESTSMARAPRFLSDQDGAFEVHPCQGRRGKCLQQVISVKPIPWGPMPDPFTLAGDQNATDYTISVDVHFIDDGPVTLMGRVDSADVFKDGKAIYPSGYILSVTKNGAWKLYSTKYKSTTDTLAQGDMGDHSPDWQHIALRFKASKISVAINHKSVANVDDSSHKHGMFALGTGWQNQQFDNLSVEAK